MKTSFVRIFDKKDDAVTALGFMTEAFPGHRHELVAQEQVQLWTLIGGQNDSKAFGAPDPTSIWLLVSIAP